jgi:hypothetical protein
MMRVERIAGVDDRHIDANGRVNVRHPGPAASQSPALIVLDFAIFRQSVIK